MIKEIDIPSSILAFAVAHNHDEMGRYEVESEKTPRNNTKQHKLFCTLNMTSLSDEMVSLKPNPEVVREAYLKVKPGGTWAPDDCIPQIKGT